MDSACTRIWIFCHTFHKKDQILPVGFYQTDSIMLTYWVPNMSGIVDDAAKRWMDNLHTAVCKGDPTRLAELLKATNEHKLDIHTLFGTLLLNVVERSATLHQFNLVEQLLRAGADANFCCDEFTATTVFMEAVIRGNMDICQLCLRYGANVHLSEPHMKWGPIHLAAQSGHTHIVALLLLHGAEIPNPTDPFLAKQRSPIALAICTGHSTVVKLLLDWCMTTDTRIQLDFYFNMSIEEGSEECAIVVLRHGCYPVQETQHVGMSYFQMAADRGFVKLISLLGDLNPHLLQECWLMQTQFPKKLAGHAEFVDWLTEYRKQPPCLRKSCKSVILAHLRLYYKQKIRELPLPKTLKTYLKALESAYDQNGKW